MSTMHERIFSGRTAKKEPDITFARTREPSIKSASQKITEMLEDILDGLNAIGPRLDAIEKSIKEVKEEIRPDISRGRNKRIRKKG